MQLVSVPVHLQMKNTCFFLLPVALSVHVDSFGGSCSVFGAAVETSALRPEFWSYVLLVALKCVFSRIHDPVTKDDPQASL